RQWTALAAAARVSESCVPAPWRRGPVDPAGARLVDRLPPRRRGWRDFDIGCRFQEASSMKSAPKIALLSSMVLAAGAARSTSSVSPPQVVTLITGDRVALSSTADGRPLVA